MAANSSRNGMRVASLAVSLYPSLPRCVMSTWIETSVSPPSLIRRSRKPGRRRNVSPWVITIGKRPMRRAY